MSHFPRHSEYKNSGNKWIGDIPSHWHINRYKNLMRERGELSKTGDETLMSVSAYTGVTTRAAILEEGEIHTRADSLVGYKKCAPDDLVVNIMLAWNRGLGFSKQHGIVSPAYCVFKKTGTFDSRFLNYLVRDDTSTRYYKSFSTGLMDSRLRLYPETLLALQCALPEIDEQKQIADFLDRETTRIDSLIEKKTRFIELLKEKRQAVITKAVTKGLDLSLPMQNSGAEWVGEVPAHWKFGPLKHFGRLNGGAGFPDEEQGRSDGELPFYKVRDLGAASASGYTQKPENYIDRATSKRLRAYIFKPDTVVFAKVGAALLLNRFRVLSRAACIDNNMMGYEPGTQLVPKYAHYALSLIRFNDIVNPGAVPSVNEKQVGRIPICVPPVSEQVAIVEYLNLRLANIDNLIDKSNRSIDLLREHRSALITAAVTGKIDVRKSK